MESRQHMKSQYICGFTEKDNTHLANTMLIDMIICFHWINEQPEEHFIAEEF